MYLIENKAPDADIIQLIGGDGEIITIERDENQVVYVAVQLPDGTEHRMVLGQESETTKL